MAPQPGILAIPAAYPACRLLARPECRAGETVADNRRGEASQAAAGAVSRRRWRKVRTAQGGVAANGCPPRGEDQSNRDESVRRSQDGRAG